MTKKEMVTKLQTIAQNAPEDVKTRIDYSLEHSPTITDLRDLMKEFAPDELKLKKPATPTPAPAVEEAPVEPVEAPVEETPKTKSTKKSGKPAPKALKGKDVKKVDKAPVDSPTTIPAESKKGSNNRQTAKFFPATITNPAGTFKSLPNMTYEELREAVEAGRPMFIATYWTKRLIREFNYGRIFSVDSPASFPNDLDLLQPVVFGEVNKRVFAMSVYTEAMSRFEPAEFEPMEDTDLRDNSTFFVRLSNGLQFEVYEQEQAVAEEAKAE